MVLWRFSQPIMTENEPHPLSRLATISNPSFWIFFGACVALYTYNKSAESNATDIIKYSQYGNYICLAAFAGLFLTLIANSIKTGSVKRFIRIFCYVFEVVSIIWLGAMIVIHK